jgi:hypothetical protein
MMMNMELYLGEVSSNHTPGFDNDNSVHRSISEIFDKIEAAQQTQESFDFLISTYLKHCLRAALIVYFMNRLPVFTVI